MFGKLFKGRAGNPAIENCLGNVIVGGNEGLIYQIYNGLPPPAPPTLNWAPSLPQKDTPFEVFNLLSWKSRLVPDLVGRDAEMADLLEWVDSGPPVRVRFLIGPGGAGKTRLAAELGDLLRAQGWHAGFIAIERAVSLPLSDNGILIIVDYPEASRDAVKNLLREAARIDKTKVAKPVRILLLSRCSLEEWKSDVQDCSAADVVDSHEVVIRSLSKEDARALFKNAVVRLAQHRGRTAATLDDESIDSWFRKNPELYALPLLITAAAVHFVDSADETVGLNAADIIQALVDRERTQLDRVGRSVGWGSRGASRLVALAALREGLNQSTLRRLAVPELEIGLSSPAQIVDVVNDLGWAKTGQLFAPTPDIVAAELLRQVLVDAGDRGPDWIWATLPEVEVERLELLGRRMHDMMLLHGPAEKLLTDLLIRVVDGNLKRSKAWRAFAESKWIAISLARVGVAVARTLKGDPDISVLQRAAVLNNLSVRLSAVGDFAGALSASRQAVDIRRRLTPEGDVQKAQLALALNNLANRLREHGEFADALETISEAVELWQLLAEKESGRYEVHLATSLHNMSNCLQDSGHWTDALDIIRRVVELRRLLAADNPAKHGTDLGDSLNNLSMLLHFSGDTVGSLGAIEEAVEIYRPFVHQNPAIFSHDFAGFLNNLANQLSIVGDRVEAYKVRREALEMRRALAASNPARFEGDLAESLNNIAPELMLSGDKAGALSAIAEAVEIRRKLALANPGGFVHHLASTLANQTHLMLLAGEIGVALAPVTEAITLMRPLVRRDPSRFSARFVGCLQGLSKVKFEMGDLSGAIEVLCEVLTLLRPLAKDNPKHYVPKLMASIAALSSCFAAHGDGESAVSTLNEGAEILVPLAEVHPALFESELKKLFKMRIELESSSANSPPSPK